VQTHVVADACRYPDRTRYSIYLDSRTEIQGIIFQGLQKNTSKVAQR
jgi:hypothetical protein